MGRQPFASSVVRMATARLSISTRPRYTSHAAFTCGDSYTFERSAWKVRPLGTGMSSNSLRGARGGALAQAVRLRVNAIVASVPANFTASILASRLATAKRFYGARSSLDGVAAVDGDRRARDEVRRPTGEEHRHARHVVDVAPPS